LPKILRAPAFDRAFKKKTPEMQGAILRTLKRLSEGDRSPGLGVKKMQGFKGIYEARVDDANRVTFERRDGVLYLRANCNHDILKNP
jgi:hypothetical protein